MFNVKFWDAFGNSITYRGVHSFSFPDFDTAVTFVLESFIPNATSVSVNDECFEMPKKEEFV